jgi:hypothetical protein
LEAEKGAVEAEARAMEFVAYGAVIGLIVLVLILASARSQQMQAAWLGRRQVAQASASPPGPRIWCLIIADN